MKEALPQILFLAALFINFITSLVDSSRNTWASFVATTLLVALTYWGGFFEPLMDFLTSPP